MDEDRLYNEDLTQQSKKAE